MKPDRMTDRAHALKVIKETEYGVLSLVDGQMPYGIAMNHVYDETKDALYFHGAMDGKKARVIDANGFASYLVIVDPVVDAQKATTYYDTAIATGRIQKVNDETEKLDALTRIVQRLCPEHALPTLEAVKHTNVYRLDIASLEGKRNRP